MRHCLYAFLLVLASCVTTSTIDKRASKVKELCDREHDRMETCTPVQMANAEAFAEFAKIESRAGRSFTASSAIEKAEAYGMEAYEKSRGKECLGDFDGDGIPDLKDLCPGEPEDFDKYQDEDGCPDLDNDLDGIPDTEDACPNEKGPISNKGCPVKDQDGDGIPDDQDRCPFEFGPKERQGCPLRDSDKDGVPDDEDQCPDQPGPKENNGCPYKLIQITDTMIVLKQKVFFAFGKAKIDPKSYPLLDEIAQALKDHPTFVVRIEGHTDNVGSDKKNLKLSQDRADAVRDYLIKKGIEPHRLKAIGYGESRPIDDNSTPEGRAVNRRVEFHIESR